MAKKQIPITKEILENIIKQNPNANYSQLVKILNKGGYVTQAAQGYDKDIDQIKKTIKLVDELGYQKAAKKLNKSVTSLYGIYFKYKDGIPEKEIKPGTKFDKVKLAFNLKKFGIEDKVFTDAEINFNKLKKLEQKNISGYLEELIKSDGKLTIGGKSGKADNIFDTIKLQLKKAERLNPSKYPFNEIKNFDGKKIFEALQSTRQSSPRELFAPIRRSAERWGKTEGKNLVNYSKLYERLGKKNGYDKKTVQQFINKANTKPGSKTTQRTIDLANAFMDAIKDAGVKVVTRATPKGGVYTFFNLDNADQDKLNKIVKTPGTYANLLRSKITSFSKASNDYKKFGGAKDFTKLKSTRETLNQALTEEFGKGLRGSEKATKLKILNFLDNNKTLYDQLSLSFDPERPVGQKIFKRNLSKLSADELLKSMRIDVDHFKTMKQIANNPNKFSFDDARISETAFNKGLATRHFNVSFKNKIVNHLNNYPNDRNLIKELNSKLKGTGGVINVGNKFVGDKPNPIISQQLDRLGLTDFFTKSADPDLLQGLGDQASFYKTLYKSIDNLPYQNKKLVARVLDCKIGKEEGGVTGQLCVKKIQEEPVESLNKLSKLNVTEGPLGQVKGVAQRMLNVLPRLGTVGKIGTVAAGAGIALSGLRFNPEKGEIVTTDNDQKADQNQILQYVKDNPLKVTAGTSLGFAAQEVPGAYKAARDLGRGRVRSTLGISGAIRPILTTFGTPLITGLYEGAIGAKRLEDGETMTDILTDPVGPVLGLSLMEPLTKMSGAVRSAQPTGIMGGIKQALNLRDFSNVGTARPGLTSKILRMGLSPKVIAGVSRGGLYGLLAAGALSAGKFGLDQYDKYQNQEGMIYNLFND